MPSLTICHPLLCLLVAALTTLGAGACSDDDVQPGTEAGVDAQIDHDGALPSEGGPERDAGRLPFDIGQPDASGPCDDGPARSDHLEACALRHDPTNNQHLSSVQPQATSRITIRLATKVDDAQQVTLEHWIAWYSERRETAMSKASSANGQDLYEVELPATAKPLYYRFRVVDGSATLFLGRNGAENAATPADDFSVHPQVNGKTVRYLTTFSQPELMLKGSNGYVAKPMRHEAGDLFSVSGLGSLGAAAEFYIRDAGNGSEDHPPGGGDYYLAADLDEAWLTKGTLFDVEPSSVEVDRIDVHTHPYNEDATGKWIYDPQPIVTLLPQNGFQRALTMVPAAFSEQATAMKTLHAQQRWIVPLLWVSASGHSAAAAEVQLQSGIFAGLKFHPTGDEYNADGPKMDAFIALAKKYRMPVQIHSAADEPGDGYSATHRIVALAQRHPDVPIVMVHTELGTLDKTATLAAIAPHKNIYAETSWTGPEAILEIMQTLDSSRTLCGTDSTVDGMEQFTKKSLPDDQGNYVYTIPEAMAKVKADAHPDAYANWARLTAIRLYRWRFRPDADLYDSDGDGRADINDSAPLDPAR